MAELTHLDLTQRSATEVALETVRLSSGITHAWPLEQPIQPIADPRILGMRFSDGDLIHPVAAKRLIEQASLQERNRRGWGGQKVRDAQTWESPEIQLLTLRALLFCCLSRSVAVAHVADRCANVMEQGDYGRPHAHYDADLAVVYMLQGDLDPAATSYAGRLEIIDPRIPFCCPNRAGHPTRGILPDMIPGNMVLFPAEFLHYVKPYEGRSPRITLAWNICLGPPPANHERRFTEQQAGVVGKVE